MIKRTLSSGFTLIELLVVIAIIGVLSALLLTNFVGIRERGGDAAMKNNARQLKTALRLYYNDFQHYPASSGGTILGCVDGDDPCAAGGSFSVGTTEFMKTLPEDFAYHSDGGQTFLIVMTLGNASDADIEASQSRCNPTAKTYYTGTPTDNDFFMCED